MPPRKGTGDKKPTAPAPEPKAASGLTSTVELPPGQQGDPPHPILNNASPEDAELMKQLSIEMVRADGEKPFGYAFGAPRWQRRVEEARRMIVAFRFLKEHDHAQ